MSFTARRPDFLDKLSPSMFAVLAHGDQRYGDLPYGVHLQAVIGVLKRFGINSQKIMDAAWLHDVLEDTDTSYSAIEARFGASVADLVFAVTNEAGRNRVERHARTYPKIRAFGPEAVILKLADRIANIEHSINNNSRHLGMYRKEANGFRDVLFVAGEVDAMWDHLHRLLDNSEARLDAKA